MTLWTIRFKLVDSYGRMTEPTHRNLEVLAESMESAMYAVRDEFQHDYVFVVFQTASESSRGFLQATTNKIELRQIS